MRASGGGSGDGSRETTGERGDEGDVNNDEVG
jgi:hypothetical protein